MKMCGVGVLVNFFTVLSIFFTVLPNIMIFPVLPNYFLVLPNFFTVLPNFFLLNILSFLSSLGIPSRISGLSLKEIYFIKIFRYI